MTEQDQRVKSVKVTWNVFIRFLPAPDPGLFPIMLSAHKKLLPWLY